MQTAFIPVSMGTAAENKPLTSVQLNVIPTELLPGVDGYIGVNPETVEGTGTKPDGSTYKTAVQSDVVVTATWLPYGSNRVTPPDIRRGERVMLYRVADTDKYYWTDLGLDANLRRLETAIFAFNANPSVSDSVFDPTNSYYVEFSTHNKTITLQTSKANGEPFTYTFCINSGEGTVTLTDDIGTYINMDSGEKRITLMNAAQSFFDMHDKNLTISVLGDIEVVAGKSIKMTSGTSTTHEAGTEFETTSGTSMTETAGTSMTGTAGTTKTDTVGESITTIAGTEIMTTAGAGMTVVSEGPYTQTTTGAYTSEVTGLYTSTVTGPMALTCVGPYVVTTTAYTLMSPSFLQVSGGGTLNTDAIIKSTNPNQPCIKNA